MKPIAPNCPCVDCADPVKLEAGTVVTRKIRRTTRCMTCASVRRRYAARTPLQRCWEFQIPATGEGRMPRLDDTGYYVFLRYRWTGTYKPCDYFFNEKHYLRTRDRATALALAPKFYEDLVRHYKHKVKAIARQEIKPEYREIRPYWFNDPNMPRLKYIKTHRCVKGTGGKKAWVRKVKFPKRKYYIVAVPGTKEARYIETAQAAIALRNKKLSKVSRMTKRCKVCGRKPVWKPLGSTKMGILTHKHDDCPVNFRCGDPTIPVVAKRYLWNKFFRHGERQHYCRSIKPNDLYWLRVIDHMWPGRPIHLLQKRLPESEVFFDAGDIFKPFRRPGDTWHRRDPLEGFEV